MANRKLTLTSGIPGPGLPVGGAVGQIPAKASTDDYDVEWVDPPAGTDGGGAVDSVNGQDGIVVLTAGDVGADPAGTAAALVDDLSGVSNTTAARLALGLGSAATQPSSAFDAAGAATAAQAAAITAAGTAAAALVDDLSGVTNAAAARTALGLGTAATQPTSAFDAAGAAAAAQSAATAAAAALVDDLSGVTNAATARSNLGLGTAATQASSAFDPAGAATTAQSAAISAAVALVDDLSGVSNQSAARSNLGLGSAATQNANAWDTAGTAAALVDDLSGVSNAAAARSNLGLGTAATAASSSFDAAGAAAAAQSAAIASAATLVDDLSGVTNASAARSNLGLGTAATANTGTGSSNVILGNDSRLTDTRTPSDNSVTSAKIVNGAIVNADINASAAIDQSKIADLTTDLAARVTKAAGIVVVDAGTTLSTARPSGAAVVYWMFDSGTDIGIDGGDVVNAQPGDLYYVAA